MINNFTMEDIAGQSPVIMQQKEKIKLAKNSKGYVWEIVLLGDVEANKQRLIDINDWLIKKYGGQNEAAETPPKED